MVQPVWPTQFSQIWIKAPLYGDYLPFSIAQQQRWANGGEYSRENIADVLYVLVDQAKAAPTFQAKYLHFCISSCICDDLK